MDVNGSARPVFMVLPTLSDAGPVFMVLPTLLSVALFSLGLRAPGVRGIGRYWPHLLTQAEPHMSSPGSGIGGCWLGFPRGIGGYCSGYWWVLLGIVGVLVGIGPKF